MRTGNWSVVVVGLGLLGACGSDEGSPMGPVLGAQNDASANPSQAGDGDQGPADPGQPQSDGGVTAVGDGDASQLPNTDPSVPSVSPDAGSLPYDYEMEDVMLTADLVIPQGKTVRVGPGVKFSAASKDTKVDVLGTLIVSGTEEHPSEFVGNGQAQSWHGIVVESGGSLTLDHAHIGGAQYGFFAMPGSAFSVDHASFDSSFKAAVVESNGRITNSTFQAIPLFPAITDAVSVDDPNGCLTIIDASPSVSNCRFDGSGGLNDMIRIGGASSPVFDHIYVHNSHCGFHASGGTNNSPRITNSILENLAYGIMAFTTKPILEDNVFRSNSTDVGFCSGATTDNTPSLSANFFDGSALKLDASCDKIGTKDASPASAANPSAGPSGL